MEDEDEGSIWLDTIDCEYDDDANWMKEPVSGDLEYIDFWTAATVRECVWNLFTPPTNNMTYK